MDTKITQHNCSVFHEFQKGVKTTEIKGNVPSSSRAYDSKTKNVGAKPKIGKYIPYKMHTDQDKESILKNFAELARGNKVLAAASSARNRFLGSLSVSNRKSLGIPDRVFELK